MPQHGDILWVSHLELTHSAINIAIQYVCVYITMCAV